jgi:hypothetical protein
MQKSLKSVYSLEVITCDQNIVNIYQQCGKGFTIATRE